jgi:hypothetical protein
MLSLDEALMILNDWLGRAVRLLLLIDLGGSKEGEPPPPGRAKGWHVVLRREGELRRPDVGGEAGPKADIRRQLTIGTYETGGGPLEVLLEGMPCELVVAFAEEEQPPDKLAFYLSGPVVLELMRV